MNKVLRNKLINIVLTDILLILVLVTCVMVVDNKWLSTVFGMSTMWVMIFSNIGILVKKDV